MARNPAVLHASLPLGAESAHRTDVADLRAP